MYNAAPPAGVGVVGGVLATTGSESAGIVMLSLALVMSGAVLVRLGWVKRQRALTDIA